MQDIFALPIEELQDLFVAAGLKKFRAKQVFQWLYQKSIFDFAAMHNLSKADIAVLQEKFTVLPRSLEILREQNSSDGMTSKLLLGLPDGNSVETVLMHHDYGYSVCVSSQVGCDMHCAFCASGLKGAVRNLTAAEIVAQVYLFNERLREHGAIVSRVVVMGSGEPMLNFDSVLQALDFLHREDTCNMSYRNMTLSTCSSGHQTPGGAGQADKSGNFAARSQKRAAYGADACQQGLSLRGCADSCRKLQQGQRQADNL